MNEAASIVANTPEANSTNAASTSGASPLAGEQLYRWYWCGRLPERHGQVLRVLVRGRMNSCLIEFLTDGKRVITSRNALRKAPP